MIAPRSAAAYPTSSNTSTAASRIFRRVASDRTWRAIVCHLRSSGLLCLDSGPSVSDHFFLGGKPNSRPPYVTRSPDARDRGDQPEPASAEVLLIAIAV